MYALNKIVFNGGIAYICMQLNVHTLSYLCFVDEFDISPAMCCVLTGFCYFSAKTLPGVELPLNFLP